jgi:PadR family transcriptional regulator, regulatory protein PadR
MVLRPIERLVDGGTPTLVQMTTVDQEVLLAALALHPNAYGVSIQEHIRKRADRERSIASIYTALTRLEERGYITTKPGEVTNERGGRRKLYVTVTAKGQAALKESVRAILSLRRGLKWLEALRMSIGTQSGPRVLPHLLMLPWWRSRR